MSARRAWVAAVLVMAAVACSDPEPANPEPGPASPSPDPGLTGPDPGLTDLAAMIEPARSPLTGLEGAGGPVLVVKIDNVGRARPQQGLDAADLVYVEPVEAGLTRLAAVFSSRLPEAVGPVRSARESDLELLRQFGTPAFGYSGAAPTLLPIIAGARVVPVSPAQAGPAYFRVANRRAPHNMFARPAQLLGHAGNVTPAPDIGFRFGAAPAGGTPAPREVARYPAAEFVFEWSATEWRWLIHLDGRPLVDVGGGRLGPPTVVLQSVVVRPSQFVDVLGNVSPYVETVGSGGAVVLRDGASYGCRWSRPSVDVGTSFTTAEGLPCAFAPGQVWVVLVPAP